MYICRMSQLLAGASSLIDDPGWSTDTPETREGLELTEQDAGPTVQGSST